MSEISRGERMGSRSVIAAILMLGFATAAGAEACNPAIDGTYCETEMRRIDKRRGSSSSMPPVQSIGSNHLRTQERPATFGAITFQNGGTQCIGLMRRSRCN
jgi:hypothetical protein